MTLLWYAARVGLESSKVIRTVLGLCLEHTFVHTREKKEEEMQRLLTLV